MTSSLGLDWSLNGLWLNNKVEMAAKVCLWPRSRPLRLASTHSSTPPNNYEIHPPFKTLRCICWTNTVKSKYVGVNSIDSGMKRKLEQCIGHIFKYDPSIYMQLYHCLHHSSHFLSHLPNQSVKRNVMRGKKAPSVLWRSVTPCRADCISLQYIWAYYGHIPGLMHILATIWVMLWYWYNNTMHTSHLPHISVFLMNFFWSKMGKTQSISGFWNPIK